MRCAGGSEIRPLRVTAWRVVESQHQVSTRKLVDSAAEQELLEQMIETAKPPQRARASLHYLLFTPFRYPPLKHGSRFGARTEPGIWYGSEDLRTAFAEVAYYRFLFLDATKADLGTVQVELTAFRALVSTKRGVDLTKPPFTQFEAELTSRSSYAETQALGTAMRAELVEAFRYTSARDEKRGGNVGVFAPAAFGRRLPRDLETWRCAANSAQVEFVRRDFMARVVHVFGRNSVGA